MTLVQSRQCLLDIHVNGIQSYSISCSFLQDLYFKFVNTLVHISTWTKQILCLFVGKPSNIENKYSLRILRIYWEITFTTHHRRMQQRVAICGCNQGTPPEKRMFSFRHCPNYLSPPPPLLSGDLYIFFGRQKGIYKVYFLIRARPSPPPHPGNARKKTFFYMRCSLWSLFLIVRTVSEKLSRLLQ